MKYDFYVESSTEVYLLRCIQYGEVTLVFIRTVIQYKYIYTGWLYWGG